MSEELDYLSTQLYDATPESFQLPIVSESTHGSRATTGQVRGLHRCDAVVRRPRLNGGGLVINGRTRHSFLRLVVLSRPSECRIPSCREDRTFICAVQCQRFTL